MNLTKKVMLLFSVSGLFLLLIATVYVAQREYGVALDEIVQGTLNRLVQRSDLQLYLYRQDEASLQKILEDLLDADSVYLAKAHNSQGEVLATVNTSSVAAGIPSLETIRASVSVTDTGLNAFDSEHSIGGTDFWTSLFASNPTIHLTKPIFSPVNPTAKGLGASDFVEALTLREKNESFLVMGYVHLAIDRSILLSEIWPTISRVIYAGLVLLILCAIPVYLIIKRATDSIYKITHMANQMASDERIDQIATDEADPFKNVAKLLNGIINESSNREAEAGLDHKLLSMKADDRASQLSQREEELSKATEEINTTREQLHQLANYDRLTSLPNRQLFTEQLELVLRLCTRNAKPLAVLFLNLNNFNRINESLGRSAGDMLLKEVGNRLVSCLRSSDVLTHYVGSDEQLNVSRIGGDEFALLLNELDDIDSAGLVAQRVTDRLSEPMTIEDHELVVTTSIGIAAAPRHGMDTESLLRAASTAMHHAKSNSDTNFLYFNDDMTATDQDDLKLESELRKAIERNELSLHYQPQVDTTNGSIVCAEALLRWEHPEFGQVPPNTFIKLAEKNGLIWELGDWVLTEACRQMKSFREQGLTLPRIAINISPQQFKPEFVTRIKEVLTSADLPAETLELGLSEATLMDRDSNVVNFLEQLKDIGVYLSLENFGTNHAPLSYLSHQPLDEIKIDRSFVIECDKRKNAGRLVTAIIAMAENLKLKIVAEGVETEGEYRFLASNGVSIMRGYLFSKPLPVDELREILVVPWHFMTQLQRMELIADMDRTPDL
jgi:diguanylate cyclase (GGDEF)-like protein